MSARQDIIDALVARLEDLTVANGYASNAGQTIYCHYPENLQVETTPCLIIRDTSDSLDPSGRIETVHTLRIEITGIVASGVTTDQACRQLIDDIVHVVMNDDDRTMADVCDTMDLVDGGSIQVEQQTDKTVGSVTLALAVTYKTGRGNWSVSI